ncbi:HPP family protein [Halobacteria archaeon HArc-gm2]|nr:HPP family protein [Halobacteria archaeon HArc-gm2]
MRDRLWDRWTSFARRARRFERRELREFRAWVERTSNLVRLSALVFVPLLVATVTYLSNTLETLSFLLFPPLASGTYTLFSNPRGKYASPVRFVTGLTVGAGCGWGALWLATAVGIVAPTTGNGVSVVAAAVAVFLAGAITWASDVEEPAAYSTALLGLLVPLDTQLAFVTSVGLTSTLVAVVFWIWRTEFYEKRATILYQSTSGDDHVLVPMRGDHAHATAMLGARLAAAHDAGKVVLLDVVEDEAAAAAERAILDRHDDVTLATDAANSDERASAAGDTEPDPERAVAETAETLEDRAAEIASVVDVPCEVVVAVDRGDAAATILQAARATGCDLLAVPYRERGGSLAPFVHDLFASEIDVLVHRSNDGRTDWRRTMVPVRQTSHVAHSMVEFSLRLARDAGSVSVCHSVGGSGNLRHAEEMLADLVEPFRGPIETRISRSPILEFLGENAHHYDIVFVGASRDRSAASRFVSPPTFERLGDLDTDVAIVDRG